MTPVLWKIPLLLAHSFAAYVSFTSPTPPPSKAETAQYTRQELINMTMGWGPQFSKFMTVGLDLCEVAALLGTAWPNSPGAAAMVRALSFGEPARLARLSLSRTYLAGWLLVIASAVLRKLCYLRLGKQFTYNLALLRDHELVTEGPYAVVRHPSYAAVSATLAGLALTQARGGSWATESGVLASAPGFALVGAWWTYAAFVFAFLPMRAKHEDEMLQRSFGEKWETWRLSTPFSLVPGIY